MESAPLRVLAAKAAQRFLQHMDPAQPVPHRFATPDFGEDLLDSATFLFKELPLTGTRPGSTRRVRRSSAASPQTHTTPLPLSLCRQV